MDEEMLKQMMSDVNKDLEAVFTQAFFNKMVLTLFAQTCIKNPGLLENFFDFYLSIFISEYGEESRPAVEVAAQQIRIDIQKILDIYEPKQLS